MLTQQNIARIKHGIQCPECSGVDIEITASRFAANAETKYQCRECGCRWDHKYFNKIERS